MAVSRRPAATRTRTRAPSLEARAGLVSSTRLDPGSAKAVTSARICGYSPKKQGAIILGTGGDGSQGGTGTFFEGAITSGDPPDAVDDAVQANVVAAGYGR